ncbi:MAG TPA: RNA polymerase sigma factor SigJ [Amycolatopsis sp.]|nr:RNA polymerase sigma factor SigJ [Amycolatopsis sp.]
MGTDRLAPFEAERGRLFGLAYRMLGEASAAEDIVQDAYLRWQNSDGVEVPAAWLTKVVTNLCLNRLTAARASREHYIGPWLPEPVFTDTGELGPLETVEQRDSLSLGMLVLLERLTPPERAAFVLHEAFAYSHREVADILDLTETHVRQLYRRARAHVGDPRKRFTPNLEHRKRILERFLAAAMEGDVAGLERLLASDVASWADGGGKASAARRPVFGRDRVVRLLGGLARHPILVEARLSIEAVNTEPAIVLRENGKLSYIIVPEISDDSVIALRTVANPDKLAFAARQLS